MPVRFAAVVCGALLALAACGDDDATPVDAGGTPAVADACLEGTPDCDDIPEPVQPEDTPSDEPAEEPGDGAPAPGGDDPVVHEPSAPAGGGPAATCPVGTPDCNDTPDAGSPPAETPPPSATPPSDTPPPDTAPPADGDDAYRAEAKELLGDAEGDLPADVRVARRGEETYSLTANYHVGRKTVELDDDGTGTFVVVSVTVELESGPETYTR